MTIFKDFNILNKHDFFQKSHRTDYLGISLYYQNINRITIMVTVIKS